MNNEKYNIIKTEILKKLENYNLQEQSSSLSALKELREKLLVDLVNNPKDNDRASILLAFYECTLNYPDFSILNNFCKSKFIEYFNTRELLEKNFNEITSNDILYNSIMNLGSQHDILLLYNYAKEINDLYLSNDDQFYNNFFNKINSDCISKGIIKETTVLSASGFSSEIEKEKIKKEEELEKVIKQEEERRDALFQEAADNIGVDSKTLIDEVGKKETLRVDKIRISSYVDNLLTNKNALISTINSKKLRNFISRINQKRVFKNLDFEIVKIDDLNVLKITGNEVALDKIASCDNNIFRKIVGSVKRKKKIEEYVDVVDEKIIKSSLINADKKAQLEDNKKINELSQDANDLVNVNSFVTPPKGYLESLNGEEVTLQNDTPISHKEESLETFVDNFNKDENVLEDKINDVNVSEKTTENLMNRYEQYDISKNDSVFVSMSPEEYDSLDKKVIASGGTKVADIKNPLSMKKM